jgi:hypothetical protein
MKLTAHTIDGIRCHKATEVTKISVWIDRTSEHKVNEQSINALLDESKKSKQMQCYIYGSLTGDIDAFDGTPLFTNGAESVGWLELDGKIIYRRWADIEMGNYIELN